MLLQKREQPRERKIKDSWKVNFFMIWMGQAFLLCGGSLVQFSVAWWITQKTGSALALSISTMVIFAPQVLVAPFAGILGDRYNRKVMMVLSYSAISLLSLFMSTVFYFKLEQLWHVYLLLVLLSVSTAFQWIAIHTSIGAIVPEQHLTRAAGINQVVRAAASIAAPSLGAVLIEGFSMASIFAVYFLFSVIAVSVLPLVAIPQNGMIEGSKTHFIREFMEGIQYLKQWRGMLILLIMSSFLTLLYTPALSLFPLLIKNHFNGGVWHYSAFETAGSIGTLVGGILLGVWGGFKRRIVTILTGVILSGIFMMIVGGLPGHLFILAILSGAFYRFAFPLADAPILAMIQSKADPKVQGRLLSMVNSLMFFMAPAGLAVIGPLADYVGVQALYVVCGGIVLSIGLGGFLIQPLMKIEEGREPVKAVQTKCQ